MSTEPRWKRTDLTPAPGREALADLIFDHFDRGGWWFGEEKPWRRLSVAIDRSPETIERIVRGRTKPKRETLARLAQTLGLPLDSVLSALGEPTDEEAAVARAEWTIRATLQGLPQAVARRLADSIAAELASLPAADNGRDVRPTGPGAQRSS